MNNKNKAAFLDRDGVINYDYGYVGKIENFKFLPNVFEGLNYIQNLGYKIIIITNQSGIGRGYYSLKDYELLTEYMKNILKKNKIFILDVLYCPHTPEQNCICRKPKPEMILRASKKHNLDLEKSFVAGDNLTDIQAGINAGVTNCFFIKNHQKQLKTKVVNDSYENLFELAKDLKNVIF